MDLTVQVREVGKQWEMDYLGIAPVDRLVHAPPGWRPTDILPGAASVVVMGIRLGMGVRQMQARTRTESGPTAKLGIWVYQVFGYNILNDKLNAAAYAVTKVLEERGYMTVPTPASPPYDPKELVGIFSHRHAAVAAGLGEFGWNKMVLLPEAGPAVRLVSVITEAELDPSPMYDGPRLCEPIACGKACVEVCPTRALDDAEKVKFNIGGRTFEHAQFDKRKCLSAPCGACFILCPAGG
jgi:epoxyqueuosine reductase